MLWDFLNGMVSVAYSVIRAAESVLSPSPVYLAAADVTAVSGVVGYAAFWLPVAAMSATLVLFMAGVVAWVVALLLKQFVEAITR